MAKPKPLRIPSDDCIVPINGVDYALHEGEWVEVVPGFTVGDLATIRSIREVGVRIAAAKGEPDEFEQSLVITDDMMADICRMFSQRILTWNWTDDTGQALPPPHGSPAAFSSLRAEELYYLVGAVQGATPAMLGKGGNSTPNTSSDTKPQQSRASSGRGRSR